MITDVCEPSIQPSMGMCNSAGSGRNDDNGVMSSVSNAMSRNAAKIYGACVWNNEELRTGLADFTREAGIHIHL